MTVESKIGSPETMLDELLQWFRNFNSCIVAFSAGVDSSLLAYAARNAIGDKALAVTSLSVSFAKSEVSAARRMAKEIGIELVEVYQDDLASEGYVSNQVNRCYFCRGNLASAIDPIAKKRKIAVCVDGTHVDDMKSPRPGVKALREAGFRAPLAELGYTKEQIRGVARLVGLSNAERPSEACLSSRIAYGQIVDEHVLRLIERSENYVREVTGAKIVRVRTIGAKALIELDKESIERGMEFFPEISKTLKTWGYSEVQIDSEGYRPGRMLSMVAHEGL